nr:aldo-keto reductase family 4 member C9-like [Ipomoea batatas]
MGYRHFDTARIYGSEPWLGNALRKAISKGVIEREDIFVTSKLWSSDHTDPLSALNQTLLVDATVSAALNVCDRNIPPNDIKCPN